MVNAIDRREVEALVRKVVYDRFVTTRSGILAPQHADAAARSLLRREWWSTSQLGIVI